MANKNVLHRTSTLKRKGDNFFSIPDAMALSRHATNIPFRVGSLKPNTKYKVMLNNHPGGKFEDIQHTARPIGEHVKDNRRITGYKTYPYLITDKRGQISFTCQPFGSDSFDIPNAPTDEKDATKLWRLLKGKTSDVDGGRHKVVLIEYSQINSPDSSDRIKTVKFNYEYTSTDQGTNLQFGALPPGIIADCTLIEPGKIKPWSPVEINGSFYQTFFINSKTVGGSSTVDITDVVLYLRRKPSKKTNKSGYEAPGIRVTLLECNQDGSPNVNGSFAEGVAYAEWEETKASPLASAGTRFEFPSPITVHTNKSYAIAVNPEDEDYVFWFSQKGDLLLVNGNKTEQRSGGSSKEHQGDYYAARTSTTPGAIGGNRERAWQPDSNLDLKFDVNIAEYTLGNVSLNMVNSDYEFIQFTSSAGDNWHPSEIIYKEVTPVTGTASITAGSTIITGSGTDFSSFTDGDILILVDSVDNTVAQVFTVDETVADAAADKVYVREMAEQDMSGSLMNTVIARVEFYDQDFDFMRAANSSVNPTQYNADNTKRFAAGDTVRGLESRETAVIDYMDNLDVSTFRTDFNANLPAQFNYTTHYKFAEISSGDIESGNAIFALDTGEPNIYLNAPNKLAYKGMIASRSLEVDQASNLQAPDEDAKSSLINFDFTYTGANTIAYAVPQFSIDEMQIIAHRWRVNNDSTNEHTNNGNASTRHISKPLSFGGKQAEDIRVILNAHRPRQTEIEVYAKIINADDSQNFQDKNWTKLVQISGNDAYADAQDETDYVEYEYTFPYYPPSLTTIDGEFTSTADSNVLTTTTANVETFSSGQVIKFYSPYFPENYGVFSIESANSAAGTITLNEAISNNNVIGSGFKIDTLATERTAFKNIENDEIVRYFGASGESYDNYETVAIKIVLLSEDRKYAPLVDDYRVIGVSA